MARRQKQQRPRRTYDDEFKREVVALVRGGQSVAEVSRNLDLTASAVRTWVDRADPPEDTTIPSKENAELVRLRAENKLLRQERDILVTRHSLLRKGVDVKCRFVDAEKAAFPVRRLCRTIELSPKTYYAWRARGKSARELGDGVLLELIHAAFDGSRQTYGSPRVHAVLAADGVRVGRKRVARLMRAAGLVVRPKKGFRATTTTRNPDHAVAPNTLDRQFTVDAPNLVWVTDVTYVSTGEGWLSSKCASA